MWFVIVSFLFLSQCKAGKVDTSVQSGKVADIKAWAGIQLHFIPCVSHSWNRQIMKGTQTNEREERRDRLADLFFFFLREINPVNSMERCLEFCKAHLELIPHIQTLCFPRLVFPSSAFPF